ncbi:MAG: DUF2807 domain-containing protein [Bacteroidia bacterium]|nr:DUF2807 domain-containing protein [Bacteroidia bacterium]
MKTAKNLFLYLFLALVGISMADRADGSDKTEIRNLKDFTEIKVSTGIDLFLKMGDTEEVKVVADDEIIDNLITEVSNGELRIYMKKTNWFNWNGMTKTRKVYVTVKELNRIEASSGSDVRSENTLTGESLAIEASSGSDVFLDMIYKNISVSTSSGSDAKLTGKAKTLKAEASSGSDINARELSTSVCNVNASSGSDITVTVSDELVARASSGSDIRYYGNPGIKDTDESSGGDISHR